MIRKLVESKQIVIDRLNSKNKILKRILDELYDKYDKYSDYKQAFLKAINDKDIIITGYLNDDFTYADFDMHLDKWLIRQFKDSHPPVIDDVYYVDKYGRRIK